MSREQSKEKAENYEVPPVAIFLDCCIRKPVMSLHAAHKSLRPLLRPLSLPYALLMAKRRELYARGILSSFTPHCPCVAVGNIAWGGTGKTPFTAWLLNWARQRNLKAVVLTRGYGGDPGKKPLLVRPDTRPEQSGDEPLMLARAFPEASVLAFPRRGESARHAQKYLEPDLFILDDGMQHLGMGRDADIVLLRPEDLEEEWNRVIPAGSWREGASALAAASAFAVKAKPEEFARLVPMAEKRLLSFGRPVFSFTLASSGLRPLLSKEELRRKKERDCGNTEEMQNHDANGRAMPAPPPLLDKQDYQDRPYILVSGVGNPAQVEASVRELLGRPPVQHFDFADHHPYSAADVQAIVKMSAAPLPVICTSKDAVKLRAFGEEWGSTPVWVMETEARFGPSLFCEESFPQWWENWWSERRSTTKA